MSSDSNSKEKSTLGEITDNLGTLFRHLLPGALIVGTARVARPSWFAGVKADWPHLAVVGVIAVAAGNAWYSVNRYGVHQVVDYICWLAKSEGPARCAGASYLDDLANYVKEAVAESDAGPRARRHVEFRASSVLLLYTLSELCLIAAGYSEQGTITSAHPALLYISAVPIFAIALWQNVITRRIDAAALHRGRVPKSEE